MLFKRFKQLSSTGDLDIALRRLTDAWSIKQLPC